VLEYLKFEFVINALMTQLCHINVYAIMTISVGYIPAQWDIIAVTTASIALYPGLLTPAFITCSINAGEGLVKLSHVV